MPLLLPKHAKTVSKTVDPGVRSLPIPQLGTKNLHQLFSLHLLDRVAMPFFGPKHAKPVSQTGDPGVRPIDPGIRSGSPISPDPSVRYRNF